MSGAPVAKDDARGVLDVLLHIYAKLDVNDRAAAVAVAYERGLLVPRPR